MSLAFIPGSPKALSTTSRAGTLNGCGPMATDLLPQAMSQAGEYWDPESDDKLVCIDVHDETHDVKSFTFVSPGRKQFEFSAGQYFKFELGLDNEDDGRCYSVSSSPLRRNAITITVKRVPGGKVSNWLHDNLTPNTAVCASGPLGRFVRPAANKFLFLSGGSGITPLMSMARELADTAEFDRCHLPARGQKSKRPYLPRRDCQYRATCQRVQDSDAS